MSVELSEMAGLARRLLQPEQVAIDEVERDHARQRIEAARHAGLAGPPAGPASSAPGWRGPAPAATYARRWVPYREGPRRPASSRPCAG